MNHPNYIKIFCALATAFFAFAASGQQLNFTRYSYSEGLNTYNIKKTIQDRYGFIWIATQDGLYRFNGVQFESFRKSNVGAGRLRENFIYDIAYPGADELFLATFRGGIDRVNVRSLEVTHLIPDGRPGSTGLPNLWIRKMSCDRFGNLWIGGRDYLAVYHAAAHRFVLLTDEIVRAGTSLQITFIKPVDSTFMAIGIADKGVLLYDIRSFKLAGLIDNPGPGIQVPDYEISDLLVHKGAVFIATNSTLVKGRLHAGRWIFEQHITLPALDGSVISCLVSDGRETIWIGTNSGLGRYNTGDGTFRMYQTELYRKRWLEDNTISDLMVDRQNNLWIATLKALQMVNLNPNPFTPYTGDRPNSARMDHLYGLVARTPTEIFATGTDGLYEVDLLTEIVKKVKGTGSLGINHCIMQVRPGVWLLSTDKGMYVYKPEGEILSQELFLRMFPEWAPFRKRYFNTAIAVDGRIFWASEEQEGLLIWDTARHTIRQYKANSVLAKGLPENHIHNLKQDRDGNIWLLLDDAAAKYSLARDSVTEVFSYTDGRRGLNSRILFDMYDDGEKLWFGTFNGGLNGYNKKTRAWDYITESEGLSNDCVYSILPERDSFFWVSTNMGISRVNYKTKRCTNYYFEDGLQDNSFDEMGSLKLGRKLFFAGINGFTSVDLDAYQAGSLPVPVYINRVEYLARDRRVVINDLDWDKLILPPRTHSIIVHLSALHFAGSHKIRFSYRLKGLQQQYLDVPADNRIVLNAVNHGDYELQIRYLNEQGVFIDDKLSQSFYIRPAWYKTWWFKALLVLAAFGLAYAFYRMRINQIMEQHKIRKDVASDLHDDIGSSLNSVKVFAHLAMTDPSKKEYIRNVEQNLELATIGLRDMIWILDDNLDSVDDLRNRLSLVSARPAEAMGIAVHLTVDDGLQSRNLSKPVKRNLFLIAKEAINNSVKYAGARNIWVIFGQQNKKLVLLIRDDGHGFDAASLNGGYGLDNMKGRAEQIHFQCHISSGETGTEITVVEK